jgi:hypothetical protein
MGKARIPTTIKHACTILILLISIGCGEINKNSNISMDDSTELYNTFNKESHLKPNFSKSAFDTLHSWDLGWEILEPINIAPDKEEEKLLLKRLSPGQKALYFFWYLDAEVTNGGFIQFYWNYNRQYLPPIIDGLKLIGDTELLGLVEKADKEYLAHKDKFDSQREKDNWEPLYNELKQFEKFDEQYYKIHDKTMELIEIYTRKHPDEFINLK